MSSRTHTVTVTIKRIDTVTDINCTDNCSQCDKPAEWLAIPDKFYCEYELCDDCYRSEFIQNNLRPGRD